MRKGSHRAITPKLERYTEERKAEFLLSNTLNHPDCLMARKMVLKLGLKPDSVPHARPKE
jgi:hypothetical protein